MASMEKIEDMVGLLASHGFVLVGNTFCRRTFSKPHGLATDTVDVIIALDGTVIGLTISQSCTIGPEEIGRLNIADPGAVLRLLSDKAT